MGKSAAIDDVFRVRLRYQDVDTFILKYAPNVSRGGLFLASREPRAVGDVFRFDVTLHDGSTVLSGEGRVTWIKEFDPAAPTKPHGMGVQFIKVDRSSKAILDRILAHKAGAASAESGLAPPASAGGAPAPAGVPAAPAAAAPRGKKGRGTGEVATVASHGRNGEPAPAVPATEPPPDLMVDDATVRRALDRARTLGSSFADIEALAAPDAPETLTKEQALAELPRLLDRADRRRKTGAVKTIDPE